MIYRDYEPVFPWVPIAFCCLALALLIIAGGADYADEVLAERHYCQMVERWNESGGETGWPPHRPEIDCEENGENND